MKTQLIVDRLQFLKRIPDCACLMCGPWVLNEIWITNLSSALIGKSSSKFISFFERSSFYLRCETVIGIVLCCCHQARCLLYYFGKINSVVFTCSSLPFNLYTSIFGCGCGFGFEQKFWRIDGFGEKRHGSADLHTPIHPPHCVFQVVAFQERHHPFPLKWNDRIA